MPPPASQPEGRLKQILDVRLQLAGYLSDFRRSDDIAIYFSVLKVPNQSLY